jgi:deoxyribonuclease-4
MKFGFHISVAGGFGKAPQRAVERHCDTIQIFSRNPRQWKFKPLDKNDVNEFKKGLQAASIFPVFVHMPYLINLASSNTELYQRSVTSLIIDLKRTNDLGAHFLIMHIGSSDNISKALKQTIKGINQALNKVKNKVVLLLENTPGQGNEYGYKFEHIHAIFKEVNEQVRIGSVLDTAHAFAAGYDLHTKKGVDSTLKVFYIYIGLYKLFVVHLNDSKTECGSRKDRHWHIGKGKIGKGMRFILNHALLEDKCFIMETPRMNVDDDLKNLQAVKLFLKDGG